MQIRCSEHARGSTWSLAGRRGGRCWVGTTKTEAKRAREHARQRLGDTRSRDVTVRDFWQRWTTDPLFARPKESSDIRRREQTKAFVDRYGHLPIAQIGDETVAAWLAGGGRSGSVQGLRSMFNDAASVKAGRLVASNPFAKLGISRGKGRRDQQPPTEQQVLEMIAHARDLSGPSFAAWLQVAAFTGLRPDELDALRWERIDFQGSRIDVAQQFNAATRKLDTPKNHLRRQAPLTAHARDALEGLAREGEFCFVSLRGDHWTPSSRAYHWKAVRAATGWQHSLYLATRHFAGWYMVNVLEMPSEDVAIALGYQAEATSSDASTDTATTIARSTASWARMRAPLTVAGGRTPKPRAIPGA